MKRFMRLGSITAAMVGGVVAIAWLVKDRLTGPEPAPVGHEEAPPFRAVPPPVPAPPSGAADDLSEIGGIGPVYKARLTEAGITTYATLAGADATEVADKIEAPVSRIQSWIDAARRRDTG